MKAPGDKPGAFFFKPTPPAYGGQIVESNEMTGLTQWASQRPLKNANQKDLLVFLAGKADAKGAAPATKNQIIAGCPDINTVGQADRALRGLMDSGFISSRYDMNTYSHIYTLNAL